MRGIVCIVVLIFLPVHAAAASGAPSCVSCHIALDRRNAEPARLWENDLHRAAGIGCHDCHGGDPDSIENAMALSAGFTGAPGPEDTVQLCGNCHLDLDRIPDPVLAADQLDKYLSGPHASQGTGNAPTCAACHGSHGIRRITDPSSRVFLTRIPALCMQCHGQKDQDEKYGPSSYLDDVHGRSLLLESNPKSPHCTDCHGAHRAAVPTPEGIQLICGNCHTMEYAYFQSGPHGDSVHLTGQPTCVQCHGYHGIEASGLEEMVGWVSDTCQECHLIGSDALDLGRKMDEKLGLAVSFLDWLRNSSEDSKLAGLDTSEMDRLNQESYRWLLQVESAIHSVRGDWEELTGMAKVKMMASWELARDHDLEKGIRKVILLFIALLAVSLFALLAYKMKVLERDRHRKHLLGSPEARQREQEHRRK